MATKATTKIPGLLESYLELPVDAGLVVLTSVLGASANWLVLRWVYALLRRHPQLSEGTTQSGEKGSEEGEVAVVLVSFLRDGAFWRDGAGKMGLDLDALRSRKRFVFVDGLTGLYVPGSEPSRGKDHILRGSSLEQVRQGLERAITEVSGDGRRVVLVVDQLDAWLATKGGEDGVTATGVLNMMTVLRERVHATIVTASADDALLHAQHTTLEREHAALVLSLAHEARMVMALRLLDTGTARDVSGVVRVTGSEDVDAAEYLYYVSGDGGVRVFERGT